MRAFLLRGLPDTWRGRCSKIREIGWPAFRRKSLGKQPELKACQAIADILDRASLEAEPIGHHAQIATQLPFARSDMVSNLAALECGEHGIGNPPPGRGLRILQLIYFAAQDIRLRHGVGPLLEKWRFNP